jgi:hypothetical protein
MMNIMSIAGTLFWIIGFAADPILMMLHFLGIGYFVIRNDEEKIQTIFKILEKTTFSSGTVFQNGKTYPSGTFVGKYFIGCYVRNDGYNLSNEIRIFTTKRHFDRLIKSEEVSLSPEHIVYCPTISNDVQIWGRSGSYTNIYYTSRKLDITNLKPKGDQSEVVQCIVDIYKKKRRATIFLSGECGVGKSTIGLLLAKEIGGSFCHTFNPTTPGDSLYGIINFATVTNESPLVLVIEEGNTLIRDVHEGRIILHKNVQTTVYNKSTYNTFLDDMVLFKNVILIMTSNESHKAINLLDPCYLRSGRIDACYTMTRPMTD